MKTHNSDGTLKNENDSVEIYRETESGVQYLNAKGRWVNDRAEAKRFGDLNAAQQFAISQGEEQSASYDIV